MRGERRGREYRKDVNGILQFKSLFRNVRSWMTSSHDFESLKEIFAEFLTIFGILFLLVSGNLQLTKFVKIY